MNRFFYLQIVLFILISETIATSTPPICVEECSKNCTSNPEQLGMCISEDIAGCQAPTCYMDMCLYCSHCDGPNCTNLATSNFSCACERIRIPNCSDNSTQPSPPTAPPVTPMPTPTPKPTPQPTPAPTPQSCWCGSPCPQGLECTTDGLGVCDDNNGQSCCGQTDCPTLSICILERCVFNNAPCTSAADCVSLPLGNCIIEEVNMGICIPTPAPTPPPVATPKPTPIPAPTPLPTPVATPKPTPTSTSTPTPAPTPSPFTCENFPYDGLVCRLDSDCPIRSFCNGADDQGICLGGQLGLIQGCISPDGPNCSSILGSISDPYTGTAYCDQFRDICIFNITCLTCKNFPLPGFVCSGNEDCPEAQVCFEITDGNLCALQDSNDLFLTCDGDVDCENEIPIPYKSLITGQCINVGNNQKFCGFYCDEPTPPQPTPAPTQAPTPAPTPSPTPSPCEGFNLTLLECSQTQTCLTNQTCRQVGSIGQFCQSNLNVQKNRLCSTASDCQDLILFPFNSSMSSQCIAPVSTKFCFFYCYPPICGNGIVESYEQCDDNNTISGDGCSSTCTRESTPAPTPQVCIQSDRCSSVVDGFCFDPIAATRDGGCESCDPCQMGLCLYCDHQHNSSYYCKCVFVELPNCRPPECVAKDNCYGDYQTCGPNTTLLTEQEILENGDVIRDLGCDDCDPCTNDYCLFCNHNNGNDIANLSQYSCGCEHVPIPNCGQFTSSPTPSSDTTPSIITTTPSDTITTTSTTGSSSDITTPPSVPSSSSITTGSNIEDSPSIPYDPNNGRTIVIVIASIIGCCCLLGILAAFGRPNEDVHHHHHPHHHHPHQSNSSSSFPITSNNFLQQRKQLSPDQPV